MAATTTSTQPAPDHQPMRRDPADEPGRPGTIPWELLGASDYRTALTDLGSWLAWLVPTYRIPPSVIPPCWFLHPGLIEELGHLWTGWRVTRLPESGVGMVGLEWDGHRERAAGRLRELVATAGCNGTTHSARPEPPLNKDDELWEASLRGETALRTARSADQAVRSAARRILLAAENRNELAQGVLIDTAADPGHPTPQEIVQVTLALENLARMAAAEANSNARDVLAYVDGAGHGALVHRELVAARDELIDRIATGRGTADLDGVTGRWRTSIGRVMPAKESILRVAASYAGKAGVANHHSTCDT